MSKTAVETAADIFFQRVRAAKHRALMIDYDGTIAPFNVKRHCATPYPKIPPLLQDIMESCLTRLVIVSGRPARDLPRLLSVHPTPEIWGTYGLERMLADGSYHELSVSDDVLNVLAQAEAELDREGLGEHIEVKLAAVALHWRGLAASEVLDMRTKAYRILEPLAVQQDLSLCEFEGGVELRLSSVSKGNALQDFISQLPPDVPVAYLGDDATDEDAFRLLNGRGLSVMVNSKRRFSAAQMWIRPPDGLVGFLKQWILACGGVQ
jgi:trehalose-phosphatase